MSELSTVVIVRDCPCFGRGSSRASGRTRTAAHASCTRRGGGGDGAYELKALLARWMVAQSIGMVTGLGFRRLSLARPSAGRADRAMSHFTAGLGSCGKGALRHAGQSRTVSPPYDFSGLRSWSWGASRQRMESIAERGRAGSRARVRAATWTSVDREVVGDASRQRAESIAAARSRPTTSVD